MRRLLFLLLFVLTAGTPAAAPIAAINAPGTSLPAATAGGDPLNLVANPSFEGQYTAYVPPGGHPDCPAGICASAQMADGWTPWWLSHDPNDPPYIIRMPEYKPADPIFTDPVRVRSGSAAQQYFTFFSTHEAGFYQQVPVIPGAPYRFGIWGHSWSAQDDTDAYSGPEDGQLVQKIGIDPTGGVDWQSANIIWSAGRIQYDFYDWFSISAVPQAMTATLFVYSQPLYPVKHNDVYWDDADFRLATAPIVPAQGLTFLTEVDAPKTVSGAFEIYWSGSPTVTWTAALDPGGTLTPTLSVTSGTAGDSLLVTVDSTGLPLGAYSANLTFTSNPVLPNSPLTLPIRLVVAEDIFAAHFALLRRP